MSDDNVVNLFGNKEKEELNFKSFHMLVMANEIEQATRTLRDLLDLEYEIAKKSTEHYHQKFLEGPQIAMKLMAVRELMMSKQPDKVILIIQDVFNLYGLDAVKAMDKISQMKLM